MGRLARTVLQLRPQQVAHRVRLRTQRAALRRWPDAGRRLLDTPRPAVAGWPSGFTPVDARTPTRWPSIDELDDGVITLLGHTGKLGDPADWSQLHEPQLWRFHLHYWDWAWPLALQQDQGAARAVFARWWRSWQQATVFGRYDEWAPYVASLRAWSWCGLYDHLVVGEPHEDRFLDALWLHLRFLRPHLERDVGGNHLVKNLKALLGLAVFFGQQRLLDRTLHALAREASKQVLPDGGHFERAPAYHCQVLADLIDIAELLEAARGDSPEWLTTAITRMRRFLGLVLLPDGTVPLFNDGYPVPGELVDELRPGPRAAAGIALLPDSGLAVLRAGELFVIADVGEPCPRGLPAHAHADTLSFLLHDGARRVVTEAGTSTYDPCARRYFERSTGGHSTVEIDGTDSTEVWAAFRAGRRAGAHVVDSTDSADRGGELVLTAEHDGYRHLKGAPVHRRTWRLSDSELRISDEVRGHGRHRLVSRVFLAPEVSAEQADRFDGGWRVEPAGLATGWERIEPGTVLLRETTARLPWSDEFRYSTSERKGAQ